MTPSSFTQLDEQREIKHVLNADGKTACSVIRPINQPPNVPLWCDVCGFPLKDTRDYHAHLEVGCCGRCQDEFYCSNAEEWKENKEAVLKRYYDSGKFDSYVEQRLLSWKPRVRLK